MLIVTNTFHPSNYYLLFYFHSNYKRNLNEDTTQRHNVPYTKQCGAYPIRIVKVEEEEGNSIELYSEKMAM